MSSDAGIGTAKACPVLHGYDPFAAEELLDPFPSWARARAEAPVFFMPEQRMWTITRYHDNLEAIRDVERFSNEGILGAAPPPPELAEEFPNGYPWQEFWLLALDGPRHTQVRKMTNAAFRPTRVSQHEPTIRALATRLVEGFVDRGRCDLMEDFAYPLPLAVIKTILGVPEDDESPFQQWAEDVLTLVSPTLSPEERLVRSRRIVDFRARCTELMEDRRARPQDDLISDLVHAKLPDGAMLSDVEVISLVAEFITAGHHTTANLIGHAIMLLLDHPEQWDAVKSDPALVPAAVEETLRFRGSARGMLRVTTQDVEIGGTTIPKDSLVQVLFSSANRDSDAFSDADSFDIHRDQQPEHLAFGRGKHFCLGAPLARLQAHVAVRELVERIPDMRPVAGQQLEYSRSLITHHLTHFELEWS